MPTSFRLPADIEARLTALAKLTGRTKTFYAVEAIREQIDALEDAHLPPDVLARVRAANPKT